MKDTYEIREPQTKEDLKGLCKYDWDLVIGREPYDVYRLEGYRHSLGGRWEDLYCVPTGEVPTTDNLLPYCGDHAPKYSVLWEPTLYIKNKWDSTSVESSGHFQILRNGKILVDEEPEIWLMA